MEKKKPRNFTLASSPFYEAIVGPAAEALVGKMVRLKKETELSCAFESEFSEGSENENLELKTLPPGIMGFIVGTANPKTVLRFLVVNEEEGVAPGVYHVKFIDLEPLQEDQENQPKEEQEIP